MVARGVDWQGVKLVVFDLDGTLYDQKKLRRRMVARLLLHAMTKPHQASDLHILRTFRELREHMAGESDIIERPYDLTAAQLGVRPERVHQVVDDWLQLRPLPDLLATRYPGVDQLFASLKRQGKKIAVLSDYPADAKLAAMQLAVDFAFSAVDPDIDCLKPNPKGLRRVLEKTGVQPLEALMIGDRDDRDGEIARRVGVPYLIRKGREAGPEDAHAFSDFLSLLHHPVLARAA
ncbi:MAG: HAD family hydrolase [Geminicoccaceae bacterium]